MGQQVRVTRDLQFVGVASHSDNVEGNISPHKKVLYEEFDNKIAVDTTNYMNVNVDAPGAATITAPDCLTLTTGTTDDHIIAAQFGLNRYGQYNACLEVRARNDDTSGMAHFIGFTDTVAKEMPFTYSGTTLASTASNGAGFLYDQDATTKNIYGVSVNGDADGAVINSSHGEADSSWATYRVELHNSGTQTNAVFYLNTAGKDIIPGVDRIGAEVAAVTYDTALSIAIVAMNRDSSADTLDIDYIKAWQSRY